jgi:DNA-binding beta-propeller fold protein YncE
VPLSIVTPDGKTVDIHDPKLPFEVRMKDGTVQIRARSAGGASPGSNSRAIAPRAAVAPDYAYLLSDTPQDAVYIVDQQTGLVVDAVSLPTLPQGIAVNNSGDRVYVTNQGIEAGNPFFPPAPPRVSVIDKASRRIVRTIDLPAGVNPGKPVVSPDDRFVYVPGSSGVVVIDAQSGAVVTTIPVSVTSPLRRASVTPDGAILFVTATETIPARVFAIDTFTREQIGVITANTSLRDLLVNYTGSRLYLLTQTSLVSIDTATLLETGTLPVRSPARLNGMALSIDGGSLFINDELATSIIRVDTAQFQVAETITFTGRSNPDSSYLMVVP